jgi:hypothetical protein
MTHNKVYIAGKVTGLAPLEVKRNFEAVEKQLTAQGYTCVNPTKLVTNINEPWELAMRTCIAALCDCSHIYLQPNWRASNGACLEYSIALKLKLIVITPNQTK